ncbi:MAG: hypothetical protein KJ906_03475 [Nanoarchaeota archaeon]|nr:hypothetical protein [Nanoarchaeota archaeon]
MRKYKLFSKLLEPNQNTKKCIRCNKEFVANTKTKKYCSKKCQKLENSYSKKGGKSTAKRTENRVYSCIVCKKPFARKSRSSKIFCSDKCCKTRIKRINMMKHKWCE